VAAQDYEALQRASVELYSACLETEDTGATESACACLAGYLGGSMSNRDFDIIGRLGKIGVMIENGASEAAVEAEVSAFFSSGYTQVDADNASATMNAVAAKGDIICAPFTNQATS
ncbi:MAG: hypothetical protein AAFW68_06035, partial [Pseudomonadota bacterium]